MKTRKLEQGSALHIVIIVVLVVAVLGLLGFVFWQNFINKSDANTQNTSEAANDVDSDQVSVLSIDGWDVQFKLSNGLTSSDFTVESPTAEDEETKISYVTIDYKAESEVYSDQYHSCGKFSVARSSDGFASVFPASPPNSDGSVALGRYSYSIVPPQAVCYEAAPHNEWDSIQNKLRALPGGPVLSDLELK